MPEDTIPIRMIRVGIFIAQGIRQREYHLIRSQVRKRKPAVFEYVSPGDL